MPKFVLLKGEHQDTFINLDQVRMVSVIEEDNCIQLRFSESFAINVGDKAGGRLLTILEKDATVIKDSKMSFAFKVAKGS